MSEKVQLESPDKAQRESNVRTPWPRYVSAALGLKNYWYACFFTQELKESQVRGEQICGERILFKRVDGKIYGIEDRCAHRGVSLSVRPTCHSKNTVSCWVHGFTYDVRDGKLVQIITDPESNLIGRVSLKNYAVEEICNVVFVWIGDQEPLPILDELPRSYLPYLRGEYPTPPRPAGRMKMLGNWRMALENSADFTHFYGHRTQQAVQGGSFPAPLSQTPPLNPKVIEINRSGHPQSFSVMADGFNFIWEASVEEEMVTTPASREAFEKRRMLASETLKRQIKDVQETAVATTYLPGAMEVGGPDGTTGLVEFYTPVDEDHHLLLITNTSSLVLPEMLLSLDQEKWGNVQTEGGLNFDAYYRAKMHHAYKNEDWFRRGRVYRGDSTIMALRRFVDKNARGIQTRDGNWAQLEEAKEMEVLYNPAD